MELTERPTEGTVQNGATYWPALDGMRAFAIVPVLVFHIGVRGLFPGGYLGVDVFFVLSGFLITTLLLQEVDRGGIRFGAFYARRALRLFPALAGAICLAVLLAELVDHNRGLAGATIKALPFVIFYVGNWWRATGHSLGLLGHTWSLAVEEQFYLVWPVLLGLLSRRLTRRHIATLLLAVAVLELVWGVGLAATGHTAARISNPDDTHTGGLLMGVALALLRSEGVRVPRMLRSSSAASVSAVTIVVLMCAMGASSMSEAIGYFVVSAMTAVLLDAVLDGRAGPLTGLLNSGGAVWTGRRSYGLYVWHYVFYFGIPWPQHMLFVALPLSFLVAAVSYEVIERPALALKRHFELTAAAAGANRT
jgi:peptidoglycan/LPS O-acetylase OafA/YrhL